MFTWTVSLLCLHDALLLSDSPNFIPTLIDTRKKYEFYRRYTIILPKTTTIVLGNFII